MIGTLPLNAAYVAYQGEGEAPIKLEGDNGVYPFEIEHTRYQLWVACPGEGSNPSLRVLALAAEDTQRPVANCTVNAEALGLSKLAVSIGDTPPDQSASFAIKGIQSRNHHILGGINTLSAYLASPGPFDLATILRPISAEPPLIRIQRDLQMESDRQIDFDFGGHTQLQLLELQTPSEATLVQSYLRTRNHTDVLLYETESSSVAVMPGGLSDNSDIYTVVQRRSDGPDQESIQLSYRKEPTTAQGPLPTPAGLHGLSIGLEGEAKIELPEALNTQVLTISFVTNTTAIEMITTEGWLAGRAEFSLRPPEALAPGWVLGSVGDPWFGGLSKFDSNWPIKDMLEAEIFSPNRGTPSDREGLDAQTAYHITTSSLLR